MLGDFILRVRSLLRGRIVEQELDDELRFHLEHQIDSYMRQGLSREDAVRRARLEFGGLDQIKEAHRDARGIGILSHFGRDLHHGLRQFRRSPGFSALAVLCLGLAIGVNTSIFGVLNSVLLRPMPVAQPDRLIVASRGNEAGFSYPVYRDFRDRSRTLSGLAVSFPMESDLDIDGESTFVAAEVISGDYGKIIGAQMALGRWFSNDTDPVAVISHAAWQRHFNLSPDVLGRTVRSESQSYTVIGVAAPEFNGTFSPLRTDLWVPIRTRPWIAASLEDRATSRFMLFGRLRDDITPAQASLELNAIDARLRAEGSPPSEVTAPIVAEHVRGIANVGNRRRAQVTAVFLTVVVGLVLLIACVNVGNLLLVRGAVRQREFALRRALGASRSRVLQQLLTESLMLAVAGGVCGVVLARWSNALLERSLPLLQGIFPIQMNFDLDWRVITFATLVSLVTTVLCGLMPAWRASRTDGLVAFKGEIVAGVPRRPPVGLVAQVVMSFVLMLVAGTFVQALVRMQTADPGFAVTGRLYAYAYISTEMSPAARRQIYSRAIDELRALPGVRTAAVSDSLPLMPTASSCAARADGRRISITSWSVDPGYFGTMGIGLVDGRDFAPSDDPSDAPVVIVNERLASGLWPDRSPIGERVQIGCKETEPATIVGVVRNSSIRSLGENPQPHLYYPFPHRYSGGLSAILVETSTPPSTLVEPVRRTLVELGQGMRVYTVRPLSEHVEQSYNPIRWQTSVLTSFGLLALVLAAVGLYGVITYRVALRTREIGVRMALGASRRNVFREVVGQGLTIAMIGVAIGGVLMMMVGRVLEGLDSAIQPPGLVVLGVTALVWILVAVAATYVPAARASGVNPLIALRYE